MKSRDAVTSSAEVTVERLGPDDWAAVRPLVRRHDPRIPEERWRLLFHHPWPGDDPHRGWALVHAGEVVGYCGIVPSTRMIARRRERLCNLTTWVVDDDFRSHSLRVITPALRLRDRTLVDLSPNADAARWNARWGFTPFETTLVAMPAVPLAIGRWADRMWWTVDPDEVIHTVRGEARRLASDHRDVPGCALVAAGDGDASCLVVWSRIDSPHGPPYAAVHHVGDPDFFRRHHLSMRAVIARAADVRVVLVDKRLVPGRRPRTSWEVPLAAPRAMRGANPLPPREVDSLYSEIVLLGLAGVPRVLPSRAEVAGNVAGRVRRTRP